IRDYKVTGVQTCALPISDVELHNIAVLNAPVTANPMHHFIIKRDANVSGKHAMPEPITQERTLYAGVTHKVRSCLIYFLGADSGANQVADLVENVTR